MNMQERLAEVGNTIDQLTVLVPAKTLSYTPELLNDLSLEEFRELLVLNSTFDPSSYSDCYYAYGNINGARVRAGTKEGTRIAKSTARAEIMGL